MSSEDPTSEIRHKAVNLLSIREYSEIELARKLLSSGFDEVLVGRVIIQLKEKDYVNNERYAEAYINFRLNKGYGLYRIESELNQKGLTADEIQQALGEIDIDWWEHLTQVYEHKYHGSKIKDDRERAKRARFLSYRGFSNEMIRDLLWD